MKPISEHLQEAAQNGDDLISVVVEHAIKHKLQIQRQSQVNAILLQHALEVARDGVGVEK